MSQTADWRRPIGSILIGCMLLLSFVSLINLNADVSPNSDYSLFIEPYLANIENLRAYLMLPPNANQTPYAKIGINPTYGLIQGDYACGGYKPLASSLNNNDLMAAEGLDYLNSQKGLYTTFEAQTRSYLAMQWNDTEPAGWACDSIVNQTSWTYPCTDKHELVLGTGSPCYPIIMASCALTGGNQTFLTSYPGLQMLIEDGVGGRCLSARRTIMQDFAPYINFLWLKGDPASIQKARQLYNATLANWTPTQGTGLGGTVGGCFSAPYWPNPTNGTAARTRDLGFWINMDRATRLWNSSPQALNITQQVLNQFWAQQKPDGSIAVDYSATSPAPCGGTASTYPKDSGETDGLAIAAFDPRVPEWFNPDLVSAPSGGGRSPQPM